VFIYVINFLEDCVNRLISYSITRQVKQLFIYLFTLVAEYVARNVS
jgi:hypothetical protein